MRALPHLTYLQAFDAAARHLSFSKAAEELNCTQSAISQRIRALEQYLGRPLFHRLRNGLELSEVGQAYRPGVAEALDVLEAATQGLVGARARRTVTVSAPISFASIWLSAEMHRFHALHPDIEVRVNSTIWTDPNVELADLSIAVVDEVQLRPELTPLRRERMVLVAPAGEPGPAQGQPLAEWINARRMIYVQGKHQLWERWADASGTVLAPRVAPVKVDNAATALEMVAGSGGISIVFGTHCDPYLAAGRLSAPAGAGLPTSLVHTVALTRPSPSPSVRKFHAWLVAAFGAAGIPG
ncbi:LysR family transcriptional regulator [Paracoccus sp. TOH]|uniref:LysR family transcriptional regulator n=1 Tax=Paracoccus sp. TOH TaxID=1263728 RepID=UPI0025B2252F|nr:LysR family transcriptional regulator [Paracoccus sp. TOH]WJS85904.1 LysR substrate-binding domain-containing protein [Paracoccus sp. TOH]